MVVTNLDVFNRVAIVIRHNVIKVIVEFVVSHLISLKDPKMFGAWVNYKHTYAPSYNYFVGTNPNVAFLQMCIIPLMNKDKFIALAGSQSDLAKLLGIKQPAISQWKAVPIARIWQLKLLRPDWFVD